MVKESQTALGRAHSQVYNGESRHIALRQSLVQDLIIHEVITLDYVNTMFNLTNFFTKAMSKFQLNKRQMTMCYWFYVYLIFKWLDGLVASVRSRDIILARTLVKSFIHGVNSICRDISVDT